MATGHCVIICPPLGVLTLAATANITPFVVNVAYRSLTTQTSPSNANHRHESQTCMGALLATSPGARTA